MSNTIVPNEERVFTFEYEVQSSSGGRHFVQKTIKGYDEAEKFLNSLYDPELVIVHEITPGRERPAPWTRKNQATEKPGRG